MIGNRLSGQAGWTQDVLERDAHGTAKEHGAAHSTSNHCTCTSQLRATPSAHKAAPLRNPPWKRLGSPRDDGAALLRLQVHQHALGKEKGRHGGVDACENLQLGCVNDYALERVEVCGDVALTKVADAPAASACRRIGINHRRNGHQRPPTVTAHSRHTVSPASLSAALQAATSRRSAVASLR